MSYSAPKRKREWWEVVGDAIGGAVSGVANWAGGVADKVIPGDQSSWHPQDKPSRPAPTPQWRPPQNNGTVTIQQPFANAAPPQQSPAAPPALSYNLDNMFGKSEVAQPKFEIPKFEADKPINIINPAQKGTVTVQPSKKVVVKPKVQPTWFDKGVKGVVDAAKDLPMIAEEVGKATGEVASFIPKTIANSASIAVKQANVLDVARNQNKGEILVGDKWKQSQDAEINRALQAGEINNQRAQQLRQSAAAKLQQNKDAVKTAEEKTGEKLDIDAGVQGALETIDNATLAGLVRKPLIKGGKVVVEKARNAVDDLLDDAVTKRQTNAAVKSGAVTIAPSRKQIARNTIDDELDAIAPPEPTRIKVTQPEINTVNPSGGIAKDYTPQARVDAPLGKNMTTLDKTMGGNSDEVITIYRGTDADQTALNAGDYVTTNKQLAKDYAGNGRVIEQRVRKGDLVDDATEPLGEEYLYRPSIQAEPKIKVTQPREGTTAANLKAITDTDARARFGNRQNTPDETALKEAIEGDRKRAEFYSKPVDTEVYRGHNAYNARQASPDRPTYYAEDPEYAATYGDKVTPEKITGRMVDVNGTKQYGDFSYTLGNALKRDPEWGGKAELDAQPYLSQSLYGETLSGVYDRPMPEIVKRAFDRLGITHIRNDGKMYTGNVGKVGHQTEIIAIPKPKPAKNVKVVNTRLPKTDTVERTRAQQIEGIARMSDDDFTAQMVNDLGIDEGAARQMLTKSNKPALFNTLYGRADAVRSANNPSGYAMKIVNDSVDAGNKAAARVPGGKSNVTTQTDEVIDTPVGATNTTTGEIMTPPRNVDDAPLGSHAETFYKNKEGAEITYDELEQMGVSLGNKIRQTSKQEGIDFDKLAENVQRQRQAGTADVNDMQLTPKEKELWLKVQNEVDYTRARAAEQGRNMGEGNQGNTYFPHERPDQYELRGSLFKDFEQKMPGNEMARRTDGTQLSLDEISYSPDVISHYVIKYGDTHAVRTETIAREVKAKNPALDETVAADVTQDIINLQDELNSVVTKMKLGVKRVLVTSDKTRVDVADRMTKIGQKVGRTQTIIEGSPRGITNGDRLNSVDVSIDGKVHTVADLLAFNQHRDAGSYAQTHVLASNTNEDLANTVANRLRNDYKLTDEEVDYAVRSIHHMKEDALPELKAAKVTSIYRNAAKQQFMEQSQNVNIANKTLRKDVSDAATQILREGSVEHKIGSKLVRGATTTTNALFRKANVSSALNEMSDLPSFFAAYGKNFNPAAPKPSLIKKYDVGEPDPNLAPYLQQVENGVNPETVFKQVWEDAKTVNKGLNFYRFVEQYKAGIFLHSAEKHYMSKAGGMLQGDELTKRVLKDYRDLALPVDMFTKTFLDDYPLFTQYMSWGVRNLQKEVRLATGQIDAGILKDKSTTARIARDAYANIPAKTAFWLASNGLKGTAFMTAFGLTDFTGMTNGDYSGIEEEDKNFYDKHIVPHTNISTVGSLLNTMVQSFEKEQLKNSDKYANADYNPYENNKLGDSLVNIVTPQVLKNASGANDVERKGYAETNTSIIDNISNLVTGKQPEDVKEGRIQYQASDDLWNTGKSLVFGKAQTENGREYTGNKNIYERVVEDGKDPFTAIADMAGESLGFKDRDYNRPLATSTFDKSYNEQATEAYEKYKDSDPEKAKQVLKTWIENGREYNRISDDLRKKDPAAHDTWIKTKGEDVLTPEKWRVYQGNPAVFEFDKKRKLMEESDLGRVIDPIFKQDKERANMILQQRGAYTGDDMLLQDRLYQQDWYEKYKKQEEKYYDSFGENEDLPKKSPRVMEWKKLSDQLYNSSKDKKFNLVADNKAITKKYGFGSQQSKDWFKVNGDAYNVQKEQYERNRLNIVNKMRKLENADPLTYKQFASKLEDGKTAQEKKDEYENKYKNKGGYKKGYSKRRVRGSRRSGGGSGGSSGGYVGGGAASFSGPGAIQNSRITVKANKVAVKKAGTIKIKAKRGGKI